MNFIDGPAADLMPFIHPDLFQHDIIQGTDSHYALANMYDPIVLTRLGENTVDYSIYECYQYLVYGGIRNDGLELVQTLN